MLSKSCVPCEAEFMKRQQDSLAARLIHSGLAPASRPKLAKACGKFVGRRDMAVGQNQWYDFGVGAPPILVYVSGDWDVHWGYLTHGHIGIWTEELSVSYDSSMSTLPPSPAGSEIGLVGSFRAVHMASLFWIRRGAKRFRQPSFARTSTVMALARMARGKGLPPPSEGPTRERRHGATDRVGAVEAPASPIG